MSQEEGGPVSSSGSLDEDLQTPAHRLIELVRSGRSFSGRERNCVFLNTRAARFANVSAISGLDFADDARAIGRVDWDHDGDIDLWISNRNGPQVRFMQNQLPAHHSWLALKLEGTRANRDAIGARVTVESSAAASAPIRRTLRAGDGYLTQSSKWLHLGLGEIDSSCHVTIHWPGGETQQLRDLPTNQRYRVVQGQKAPQLVEARSQPSAMQIANNQHQEQSSPDELSVYSVVRPPLPQVNYLDDQDKEQSLNAQVNGPTLLVLWASWCQPCIAELGELTARKDELRKAGLNVIAINVDRLSPDAPSDAAGGEQAATQILGRLQFPYTHGRAIESMVDKLQIVNDYLFGLKKPFPVPTSLLIDKDFRLAAIYRGQVDLENVLQHVQLLEQDALKRRDPSVPFPGKWAGEPRTLQPSGLVVALMQAGYLHEASEIVQRVQGSFSRATILDLVVRLGVAHFGQGSIETANLHFEMARKILPSTIGPEMEMGRWYEEQALYPEAKRSYETALKKSPESLPALNNLAWLLATCPEAEVRDADAAVRLAKSAVKRTRGQHPGLIDTLATSVAAQGNYDMAVKLSERAIELARSSSRFNLAGQIKRRQDRFRDREPYQPE